MDREFVAKVLYAHWCCDEHGLPDPKNAPNWEAYRNGGSLNPVGLTKTGFLESADIVLEMMKTALESPEWNAGRAKRS